MFERFLAVNVITKRAKYLMTLGYFDITLKNKKNHVAGNFLETILIRASGHTAWVLQLSFGTVDSTPYFQIKTKANDG